MTEDLPRASWQFVDTPEGLSRAVESLSAGTGPVGVDAERASGYRYGNQAYLIQFFQEGGSAFLVDPRAFASLAPIQEAIADREWIFHAASQDLPSLADEGLVPTTLFDTELASRLLGFERVGLGSVIEKMLGISLEKAHSAADWSTRPLPEPWLEYAALDVTLLPRLRAELETQLRETEKLEFAEQEFAHLLAWTPKDPHPEPWRKLSGLHTIQDTRNLAIARELWLARDALAQERDTAPGRLLPDSSIIAVAKEPPRSAGHLARLKSFHGRASRSELDRWWQAIYEGKTTADLPAKRLSNTLEMPPHRTWPTKYPAANLRLQSARRELDALATEQNIPLENLLTPEIVRKLAWLNPIDHDADSYASLLAQHGARPWQVSLTAHLLNSAFQSAEHTLQNES